MVFEAYADRGTNRCCEDGDCEEDARDNLICNQRSVLVSCFYAKRGKIGLPTLNTVDGILGSVVPISTTHAT